MYLIIVVTALIISIQQKAFKYDFAIIFLLMKLLYIEIIKFHSSDVILFGICSLAIGNVFHSLRIKIFVKVTHWNSS